MRWTLVAVGVAAAAWVVALSGWNAADDLGTLDVLALAAAPVASVAAVALLVRTLAERRAGRA